MKLGDYLTAINKTKVALMDEEVSGHEAESIEKAYQPFLISRCLSAFEDCIFHLNELNLYNTLDKKQHFDYLRLALRKRNRYSPWLKSTKHEHIDLICSSMKVNKQRALEYLNILTDEQIEEIKKREDKGGYVTGK